jgi:hypothetical protein
MTLVYQRGYYPGYHYYFNFIAEKVHPNPHRKIQFRGCFMDHHSQDNHSRFFHYIWGQCWWRRIFLLVDLQSKHWLSVLQSFHCSKSKNTEWSKTIKKQLEKVNGGIMKEANDLRLQVTSKNTLFAIDIPKLKPKMSFLASWWCWISWLDIWKQIFKILVLWGYLTLIYFQTSNWKKAIQKSTHANLSCKMFQDDSSNEKKSLLGLCLHTKRHTVDILPYSQLYCFSYWFAEEHNCGMHPYSTKSHMSNMQDCLLQLMQLIQHCHMSSFSTVIINQFYLRRLPS